MYEVFVVGYGCFKPVLVAEYLFDVSCVMDLDEISGLGDVHAIKAMDDPKRHNLNGEFGVDGGDDTVRDEFGFAADGEVIDLSEEID